jgi:LmbE family N-acetylglucosaminyl deacetylase
MRVLHVSPHPDDELLGCPGVLFALSEADHDVTSLTVSLGREEDHARRAAELVAAADRTGLRARVLTPPLAIGRDDDRAAAQASLTHELVTGQPFDLLIAPSPHDGHHGHEVVGRAAVAAAGARRTPLWLWGLWSELPIPTLLHPFGATTLTKIRHGLTAYAGELKRNDYLRLIEPRAQTAAVLGPERVFGFGSPGIEHPYAELLTEAVPATTGVMLLGAARRLDPAAPLAPPATVDIGEWLRAPSPRDALGRGRAAAAERQS